MKNVFVQQNVTRPYPNYPNFKETKIDYSLFIFVLLLHNCVFL